MKITLKDIRDKIGNWDDELSISAVIKKIQDLNPINPLHGVMCWSCGRENRKTNKVCRKCDNDLY